MIDAEPYTRLVARFAALTTTPYTAEHTLWALAAEGAPVQLKEWKLP
jgi:hypothetical protein